MYALIFPIMTTRFLFPRLTPYEWCSTEPCLRGRCKLVLNQYTLGNSLWFPVGGFMQQGSAITPHALSTRCLSAVWWVDYTRNPYIGTELTQRHANTHTQTLYICQHKNNHWPFTLTLIHPPWYWCTACLPCCMNQFDCLALNKTRTSICKWGLHLMGSLPVY